MSNFVPELRPGLDRMVTCIGDSISGFRPGTVGLARDYEYAGRQVFVISAERKGWVPSDKVRVIEDQNSSGE